MVMGKCSVLVWNNSKSQRSILHAPGCTLPETSINENQDGLTKFYIMFAEIFKESDRFHARPEVATPQKREEWTHHPPIAVVTDTEDRDFDNKDIAMPPLTYLEKSNDEEDRPCESPSNPPSMETTPESGLPSEKPIEEPTFEPDSGALSEPSAPTREGYMGNLAPKDTVRYQKGSYPPRFSTLEENTK